MPKFKRPGQYQRLRPEEAPMAGPKEGQQQDPRPAERPAAAPKETPVCGIGGCTTWYDDPVVMERHKRRQHGIGGEDLNKPRPRNAEVKLV